MLIIGNQPRLGTAPTIDIKYGMLAWWDFEADGSDSHTTERDLTLYEVPTFAAGKVDNAMTTSNTAGSYASSTDTMLMPVGPRTWAGWFYLANNTFDHPIVAPLAHASGAPALLQYDGETGDLSLTVNDQSATFLLVAVETWYFAVITYDGAGNWSLDLNDAGAETIAGETVTPSAEPGFLLGYLPAAGTGDISLDSWGVWARLLTAAEKTALYNEGNGKKYSTL